MGDTFAIRRVEVFERPIAFLRPFRFGSVTVTEAPQAFVRVAIERSGGVLTFGWTAEMMMPKWFDKRPEKSPGASIADLRSCLTVAARLAPSPHADTAFGHACRVREAVAEWAGPHDVAPLAAAYGPSLLDKAVLDALARARHTSFLDLIRTNALGVDARLTPDLTAQAIAARLGRLSPAHHIAVRHTVGMADALEGEGSLAQDIAAGGLRYFKIKLRGEPAADHARVLAIARLIERLGLDYRATVDANEQYTPSGLAEFWVRVARDSGLEAFRSRLLLIEQPVDRVSTFAAPLSLPDDAPPVIIDEADDQIDAFARARVLGYRGVSSKLCKGLYSALLNAVRVSVWGDRFLLSGEDLTCQAGLAVQQDTAFVTALGLSHVERNGHHYVDGFGPAPRHEAEAFRAAHPDLYAVDGRGRPHLNVTGGKLATASLFGPGFASAVWPEAVDLTPVLGSGT